MSAHLEIAPISSYLSRVAEPALRSLVVAGAVGVSLAALRVSGTKMKLAAWRGVLGVAVAMPLLSFALPAMPFSMAFLDKAPMVRDAIRPIFGWASASSSVSASAPAPAEESVSDIDGFTVRSGGRAAVGAEPAARASIVTYFHPVLEESPVIATEDASDVSHQATSKPAGLNVFARTRERVRSEFTFARALAIVYFAGFVCLAARMFTGFVLGSRLARRAKPIRARRAIERLDGCSNALDLHTTPRLAESAALTVPVTFGVMQPVVLLPNGWESWSDAQLDSVFMHELSHVARRDALAERVSLIHRAIFWFSPLSWWLDRELAKLAEQASDEAALASGIDREQYAETLLGFLSALQAAPGRVRWQGVSMAASGQAEKRMERILRWKGESEMQLKRSAVVAMAAIFVPVVCVASAFTPQFEYTYLYQDAKPAPAAPAAPSASATPAPEAAPSPLPSTPNPSEEPMAAPARTRVMVSAPAPRIEVKAYPAPYPEPKAVAPYPPAYADKVPPAVAIAAAPAPIAVHPAPPAVAAAYSLVTPPVPPVSLSVGVAPHVWVAMPQSSTIVHLDDNQESYAIVSGQTTYCAISAPDSTTLSTSPDGNRFTRDLRKKYGDHFIWFRKDGKQYLVTDPATVARAVQAFAKMNELGNMQEELGTKQEALGKQQEQLGELQGQIHVNMPDLTAEMDKLNAELKDLNSPANQEAMAKAQANLDAAIAQFNANSPDMEKQLEKLQAEMQALSSKIGEDTMSRIQEQIGDLQAKIGEAQAGSGEQQAKLGELQSKLGEKQAELGEKQGQLGEQQEQASKDAEQKLRKLFDEAVASGTAKPQ